jgi:hypothetical protein
MTRVFDAETRHVCRLEMGNVSDLGALGSRGNAARVRVTTSCTKPAHAVHAVHAVYSVGVPRYVGCCRAAGDPVRG